MPYIPATGTTGAGQCFTGGDNEIWSYGQDNFEIMKEHILLRERLKPYLIKIMDEAHTGGTPPMRPMFYEYPNDPTCWEIDDQYMFGPDLLICPIMELGQRQRKVYLPKGHVWQNAYTKEEIDGGVSVIADAPIENIPVFIRKGAEVSCDIFRN
jgi:alpha-D-xyloside xylohydrolase